MRLLIAIPVHNEQQYVLPVLQKVRRYHDQILVIDDGSSDGTPDLLATHPDVHVIRHQRNLGYGRSLIDAFAYADRSGFDWVITMDCDEQHEPEMIPEFIRRIREDDMDLISGSRYLSPRQDDDPPPSERQQINLKLTKLINRTLGMNLTDSFCGYKAHRVAAMRRVHLSVTGYAFPMQLWPQVAAAGLRVTELPVRLIYNDPNRHFGGKLDDAEIRLRHYQDVFRTELHRAFPAGAPQLIESCCCAE